MDTISAFNTDANEYDKWYHEEPGSFFFEAEVKAIEALKLEGFGVEVGVGTGIFSLRLGIPLGIDPAIEMIEIAKKRGVDVVCAVSEFLPIKNECLDFVAFIFTICFLKNIKASLKEAWRILKTRGNIIIGFISLDSELGNIYLRKKTNGHRLYKYANFYSVSEVEKMLQSEGFTINKYSTALIQSETMVETEEPTNDLSKKGFVFIKAIKNP